MKYVTEQGKLRDQGETDTVIDKTLAGTGYEGMRTDDWMFYYADIYVETIQYGKRTQTCEFLKTNESASADELVLLMADFGHKVAGVYFDEYDTRVIADTKVDTMADARPWTFQFCSEYGWFQVPSKEHVMRPTMLEESFWTTMCQRSFGDGMVAMPKATETTIDQGGLDIAESNIFFSSGVEDPWRWIGRMESNDSLNQVVRVSDCDDCAHCVDLYNPRAEDPAELKETRKMIESWVDELLGKKEMKQPVEFLQ